MKNGNAVILGLLLYAATAAPGRSQAAGPLRISLPSGTSPALAVLDSRPDVVSGDRKETYTGKHRSLYGIPYPSYTDSGRPLATDIAYLIERAIKLGGAKPTVVIVSPYYGHDRALASLRATPADRLLLFELRDWWTDVMIHTDFHYDVKLTVFNREGQELGATSAVGHDSIGRHERSERREVGVAVDDIVRTLLTAPDIAKALEPGATPTTKAVTCSVEQVLKMKDAGLSQSQIEAACGDTHQETPNPR